MTNESLIDALERNRSTHKIQVNLNPPAQQWLDSVLALLFPQYSAGKITGRKELADLINTCDSGLEQLLIQISVKNTVVIKEKFAASLLEIQQTCTLDAQAILNGDPAAKTIDEVILTYPGFYAIAVYRIAHRLLEINVPLLPRILTELSHRATGIDIHPGATVGKCFCIDHGTGIVIGETTIIKDHVKIYQGVSLGALTVEKNKANKKRHPTIEDRVVIYANATILGGATIIGADSVIGGNVWITESIPPNSIVYHKGDTSIKNKSEK